MTITREAFMAIATSRTKNKADVKIDVAKCTGCGLCVSVCKDFGIVVNDGKAVVLETSFFGCIGCGHCMAVCPSGAVTVSGRTLEPADLLDLADKKEAAGYGALFALMRKRRSIREFIDKPVEREIVDKILDLAVTSPMGLPPSDVHVLVLHGKDKVRDFAKDFCDHLETMKWLVSDWFLALMRPFWGKASDELFRSFVKPLFPLYIDSMKKGVNLVNYDAPLAMYFYGTPYADPADPIVAATHAMMAGESLGLGTCMLGAVHPFIQSGKKSKRFRERHGIRSTSREGLFVIFGYPAVTYRKGIKRTFASVEYK